MKNYKAQRNSKKWNENLKQDLSNTNYLLTIFTQPVFLSGTQKESLERIQFSLGWNLADFGGCVRNFQKRGIKLRFIVVGLTNIYAFTYSNSIY